MEIEKMIADISFIYLLLHNTRREMKNSICDSISLANNKLNFIIHYNPIDEGILMDYGYCLEIKIYVKKIYVLGYDYYYKRVNNNIRDIIDNPYDVDSLDNYQNILDYLKKSQQRKQCFMSLKNGIPDWAKNEIQLYYNQLIYSFNNFDNSKKIKKLTNDASKGIYYGY